MAADQPDLSAPTTPPSTAQPRILVVEDEPEVRRILVAFLRLDNLEAIEAADGEQGFAAAMAEQPALIVSDVMMPRVDGITMLHRLRAQERTRDIPVLLVSGNPDLMGGLQVDGAPVRIIDKPLTYQRFLGVVRDLLPAAAARQADPPPADSTDRG